MITKEEIRKIASLSKLYIEEEQLESLTGVTGLKNVFREDTVVPSFPQEEILANADGGENGYFPVKKRM